MNISRSFDEHGATIEHVELSDEDRKAIGEAHKILSERCAATGVEYGEEQKRWTYWCFLAALRIGGADELMRYAREVKIRRKAKIMRTGYCGATEVEDTV